MISADDNATVPTSRRRTVAIIAGGIVAAAALAISPVLFTNALFTSQATVSGQTATTATVEIEAGVASTSSPLSASSMLPGDTASTLIELENSGTESVYYTVRVPASAGGDSALEDTLQVTVSVGATSETRTLSSWQDGALQIGTALAAAATTGVTVTVSLPVGTDDSVQSLDIGFSLVFDAIQQRNTPAPTAGWVAD